MLHHAPAESSQIDLFRKESAHLAVHLDLCIKQLQQNCQNAESDFLNIGERLQNIYEQATRMTQNAQAAVEHVGLNSDNSAFTAITQTARRAMSDLALEQSRMIERMKNVGIICHQLHRLHNMTGGLGRIAKTLKIVAINISIESCRAVESRESFAVLSKEIRTLSNTVASVAQTLTSDLQIVTQKLETMQQVMSSKLNRFVQLADEARDAVDQSNPECQTLIDNSVKVLQQVGESGQAISRSMGEIVVSLQIHDNVSQRVEHIAEALSDARLLVLQLDNTIQPAIDCVEPIAAIDTNLELQLAQLAHIIAEIDMVHQKSVHAFETIGHTARDITTGMLNIARGDASTHSNTTNATGSIGSLKAAVKKIRTLIGHGDEAVDEFKAIASDATTAVARIGGHMEHIRQVNFDIHLKSLNAIFKATHLGNQGRTIGVLVQEMKDLATQSKDLVEQIESINSAIMDQADRLQEHFQAANSQGQSTAAISSGELDSCISEFTKNCAIFMNNADQVAELSHTLDKSIAAAGDQLAFLQPFAKNLRSQEHQLNECRTCLAPLLTTSGGSNLHDKAKFADRYTMQQERDIHTTVLERTAVSEKSRTARPAETAAADIKTNKPSQNLCEEDEKSQFGENVELF